MITRILVPHDLEATSDGALAYARELARTFGAELLLLHVMENHFMRAMVSDPRVIADGTKRQLMHRLTQDDLRLSRASVALEESDQPADAILDFAKNAKIDLIVMGTHGRRAVERLVLGSVAERVVRSSPCPVLTVRHQSTHEKGELGP
jgi:nucleotide-binding universal stress UspA family protein